MAMTVPAKTLRLTDLLVDARRRLAAQERQRFIETHSRSKSMAQQAGAH
jgi:hypothetical protein